MTIQGTHIVTVFGGTGFLGRRIVARLLDRGFIVRVASRHPERIHARMPVESERLLTVRADILDPATLDNAVVGSRTVINAVSQYVEHDGLGFERVHVDAAADLAAAAHRAGVRGFVQISGIGASAEAHAPYARARGRGELAVTEAFAEARIARLAVLVGRGDAFLSRIIEILRTFPLVPLFGDGSVRLQPLHVDDAAEGIVRLAENANGQTAPTHEFAGPEVCSYRSLLERVAGLINRNPTLVGLPYSVWYAMAALDRIAPLSPVSRHQVDLMRQDNVANPRQPGLGDLGVTGTGIDDVVTGMIRAETADGPDRPRPSSA